MTTEASRAGPASLIREGLREGRLQLATSHPMTPELNALRRATKSSDDDRSQTQKNMAEGAGFEPARGLNTPNPLSRRAH